MKLLFALLFAVPALVSGDILDNECGPYSTTWIYSDSVSYSILSRSKYRSLCTVDFDRSDSGKIKLTITGNSLNSSQCQVNVFDGNNLLSKTGGSLNYPYSSFTRSVTSDNSGELYLHVRGSKCDSFGLLFTVQKLRSTICTGYTCADGQCKSTWVVDVCDGVDDCDDGSDEWDCTYVWSAGAYVGTVFGIIAFVVIVSAFSTVAYRRRRVLVTRTTVVQPAVVQSRW